MYNYNPEFLLSPEMASKGDRIEQFIKRDRDGVIVNATLDTPKGRKFFKEIWYPLTAFIYINTYNFNYIDMEKLDNEIKYWVDNEYYVLAFVYERLKNNTKRYWQPLLTMII